MELHLWPPVTENNWLGRGIRLRSRLDLTPDSISGSIAVSNPNFNYTGNAVDAYLDISSSDLITTSGYESSRTGFGLGDSV